jgi:2,3-dihydroxy-p-cumate/2,3-dihydroxybenzoate 3,4-dioxygenase
MEREMINLHDIRYARLGTPDLDSAIKFATHIVRLQLVAREGNAAYFRGDKVEVRGDTRDHTLVYFEGGPSDQTIALELYGRSGCRRRSTRTGGTTGAFWQPRRM